MSDKILKLSLAQTLYQDLRERINALPTDSDIPEVPVQDVQINGTSITENGVANVPIASTSALGVVKTNSTYGIEMHPNYPDTLRTTRASEANVKDGRQAYQPIVPSTQHFAAFWGLAKAAGDTTQSASSNTVGVYTDSAKQKIQNMFGITGLLSTEESSTATAAHAINSTFMMDGKLHRATAAIAIGDAVTVGTNCEVVKADEVFVKKTDKATSSTPGLVRFANNAAYGIWYKNAPEDDVLRIAGAGANEIKAGSSSYMPIVPAHLHESIYYGLSKLVGVDLANETVTVGTYPEASKTAIRTLIGAAASSDIPNVPVLDVQIDEISILNNGIANIPVAASSTLGLVQIDTTYGIEFYGTTNKLRLVDPAESTIKAGTSAHRAITPFRQHLSVFYGLSKAAGVDLASQTVTLGIYPETSKVAIRSMIGATSNKVIAVQDEQPTDTDTKIWLPETEAAGILVPTMEDMANYVLKTDYATSSTAGIVKVDSANGVGIESLNKLYINYAPSNLIKSGTGSYRPITPPWLHESVFYGLAKAAGDTTQATSDNTVGTYTSDASAAIRTMIGTIGSGDYATSTRLGLVKVNIGYGITVDSVDRGMSIIKATSSDIKTGTHYYKPIVPYNLHESVFYALAKAAGDATQSASSNAVGTYTTEAKAAIHTMLGIDPASIAAQVDIPLVETVSGTTPTITGQPNVRYVCGEVSTISITPPASGSVDVIFESGSTATTMTVPSTVKWPAWFDATSLEADTTYEILITDSVYGSVMTWAT